MKEIRVKSLSLIILSILLMFTLTTNVLAVVDITANSTTNNQQSITEIQDQPTFSTVNETVYAKNNTNIKESYTTSSNTLGSLTKDQSITRTGVSSNGWSRVKMANGTIGYVQTTNLTTTAPASKIDTINTSVYNNITTNTNSSATNNIPQAGLEDNTGLFIVI